MLSPVSIIERAYAAAALLHGVLEIECLIVGPNAQITLEFPPNHLCKRFCKQVENATGRPSTIEHFFSRCEQLATNKEREAFSVYNCPYGLTNILVPAFDNDNFVCALQIGPILMGNPDDLLVKNNILSPGVDLVKYEAMKQYLENLPQGNISFVMSIAKLASALINDDSLSFKAKNMDEELAKTDLSPTNTTDDVVAAIQQFVLKNFTNNDISLDMVAKHVYAHPSYVSRIFSKQLNSHFRTYINDLRIEMAVDLLENSDKGIGDICHEVGFSDHSYFNKVFKQMHGVTPSEYRMKKQGFLE